MPTDPNNTRYPAPFNEGEDDWDEQMESNLDQQAVDIPDHGTIADRPSASASFAPDFYYATDEQVQYFNEGTTWRAMDIGARLLSSFSTLQEACDWSDKQTGAGAGAIIVDGTYTVDEPTVTLGKSTHFVGFGILHSEIDFVRDTSDPMFEWSSSYGLQQHSWFNLTVKDSQSGTRNRPAFKPDTADFGGSFGRGTVFRDVSLIDVGGVFPFELTNAYWSTVDNLAIRSPDAAPTGHFKFDNCNACNLSSVKSLHNDAQDAETPCIYLLNCFATGLNSPHIEHMRTDAAMQISGGFVTVKDMHIEGNTASNNPADYHCSIQVGDGGLTRGNTGGTTKLTQLTVIGGGTHGSNATEYEGIRLLNVDDYVGIAAQLGGDPTYNYRGSNQHTQAELTTDVRCVTIFGDNDASITNNSSETSPPIVNFSPLTQTSDANLTGRMNNYQIQWGHGLSGGTHSMAYKDGTGTIHVWDANRTL